MKKRISALLLALALVCALLPWSAMKVRAETNCGENLTWGYDFSSGTLTIDGSGEMYDWENIEDTPWLNLPIRSVVIHSGVTSIGDNAFASYDCLGKVSIPDTVTRIGRMAFAWCSGLPTITLPNGLTSIGDEAFLWCSSLTSITIPGSVKTLGFNLFDGCSGLKKILVGSGSTEFTSVNGVLFSKDKSVLVQYPAGLEGAYSIPSGTATIGVLAFSNCKNLTGVTIPASVRVLEAGAFSGCTGLTSVTIPEGVVAVYEKVFNYCFGLKTVSFPSTATFINDNFYDCGRLEKISVAAGNTHYCTDSKGVLYTKDKSVLMRVPANYQGSFVIPNSVQEVWGNAFMDCQYLTSLTLPSHLTYIPSDLCAFCTGLTSIVIPEHVTEIQTRAFQECFYMTEFSLPYGLTRIGDQAFFNCRQENIIVPSTVTEIGCEALGYIRSVELDPEIQPNQNVTLYGKSGSAAETYAQENGLKFVAITKPVMKTQPKSASAAIGQSATFQVSATGMAVKYQWQYRKAGTSAWTDWPNANGSSLTVKASATNNGCQYRCRVSNPIGIVNSAAVTLTVSDAAAKPTITAQPKSATAALGQTASFRVTASGTGLSYQWQYKKAGAAAWSSWSGKTAATLTVTASATNGGCQYRCVVSNAGGSVTSSAATLTVTGASAKPTITTQPANQSTTLKKTVTFKVVASGTGLSYQWQYSKNNGSSWSNWSGKTDAALAVTASATNNGCLYRCVVKNSAGSVTSNSARLTVTDSIPVILVQPKGAAAAIGKSATFKVVAGGSGLSYQWQYRKANETAWHNWSGKTAATLTVTASATNGDCQYRCVVKNSFGSVTSAAAKLTVN